MIDTLLHFLHNVAGWNNILYHAVLGLIIGLLVIASGKVVQWLLVVTGKRIFFKTETLIDDEIIEIINSRIISLSSVIGIYFGINELRLGLTKQNETFITFLDYADTTLYIVTVIIIASLITQIVRTVSVHTIRSIAERQKHEQFNTTLIPLINRVVTIAVLSLTGIVVFEHFGYSVSSLLTILGAGSLALGLAAQDTISNMISGFIIMIDRPFRVGDRIKIPTGETGDVFEIGLRSTKIMDFDNNVLIVPNNELVKTKIINYGYPDNETRVTVEVLAAYGSNIDLVKSILLAAARSNPNVLAEPAPEAFLMKYGEYGLHFSVFCRVADYKFQFPTAEFMRVVIYNEFKKAKIEIPFHQHVPRTASEQVNELRTASKRKNISR